MIPAYLCVKIPAHASVGAAASSDSFTAGQTVTLTQKQANTLNFGVWTGIGMGLGIGLFVALIVFLKE